MEVMYIHLNYIKIKSLLLPFDPEMGYSQNFTKKFNALKNCNNLLLLNKIPF